MSGVEALGLACNVMQVISFTHETIVFCKAVYEGRSPDSQLQHKGQLLINLSNDMRNHAQTVSPRTASQKQLCDISTKCAVAARALEEEIRFINSHQAQGNLAATLRIAVRSNWRKARLDRLDKSLRDYQDTLDTHLLARIFNQNHAFHLQSNHQFLQLDKQMQDLIADIASGQSKTSDLIRDTALSANSNITKEMQRGERNMKTHTTNTVTQAQRELENHITETATLATEDMRNLRITSDERALNDQKRQEFLQSLKFPKMNERKTNLREHHEGTFLWVLNDNDNGTQTVEGSDDRWSSGLSCDASQVDSHTSNDSTAERQVAQTENMETSINSILEDSEDSDRQSTASAYFLDRDPQGRRIESWDNLSDWLKSESRVYWISGKPGSGKSTLVKFLLDNCQTADALRMWSHDVVILSHFFWRPGTPLQNNIKGLLLSLLHQFLCSDLTVLNAILAQNMPDMLVSRSEPEDWSEEELETTFFESLNLRHSGKCIFLDGLDEVCQQDGSTKLLQLIDRLREIPDVKLCVASRPEPYLESKFDHCQHLRLQDLTSQDMAKHAQETLDSCWGNSHLLSRERRHILNRVLLKAQGVFLWLHFALKDLQDGILNYDSYEELNQRVRSLSPNLDNLYWDMWKRRNENTTVHREVSAQYFNLVFEFQSVGKAFYKYEGTRSPRQKPTRAFYSTPTLLELLGALDSTTQNAILEEPGQVNIKQLVQHWNRTSKALMSKFSGFIEFNETRIRAELPSIVVKKDLEDYIPFLMSDLNFVHRTAYDFLVDTPHGQEILAFDSSSPGHRRLSIVRGALVRINLIQRHEETEYIFYDILSALFKINEPELDEEVQDILRLVWICFDNIRSRRRQVPFPGPPGHWHFLSMAAFPKPAFCKFVISQIRNCQKPAEQATIVLRNMHGVSNLKPPIFTSRLEGPCIIESLLALGADPNLKAPLITPISPRWGQTDMSILDSFAKAAVMCDEVDTAYLQHCLKLLLAHNPATDHRICLLVEVCRGYNGVSTVGLFWEFQFRGAQDDKTIYHYVLECNVSFLVDILLQRIGLSRHDSLRHINHEEVQPYAWTVAAFCKPSLPPVKPLEGGRSSYLVKEEISSDRIIQALNPWLCSKSRCCFEKSTEWDKLLYTLDDYMIEDRKNIRRSRNKKVNLEDVRKFLSDRAASSRTLQDTRDRRLRLANSYKPSLPEKV